MIVFPGTFAQALSSNLILAGSRLLLRGGTYAGDFVSRLVDVTIQPYPGERAIIDGSFVLNGSDMIVRDLEFTYSGWTSRTTDLSGSTPADIPHDKVLTINAPRSKVINCLIHDMAGGPGFWTPAVDSEIYGCVIWNNGWNSTVDRGHGHSFYTQNNTGIKTIKDCIACHSFSTGLKIYTQGGRAQGYSVVGNTMFDSAVLYDGNDYGMNFWVQDPNSGTGYTFDGNMSYHSRVTGDPVTIGLYDYQYGVRLRNNYFPEGIVKNCEILEETGNTYGAIGNQAYLRANTYDANRANLTIYNQAAANTVNVDVSALFGASGTIKAHNVQDYFTDIQTLTITSGSITVNMQAANRTVATPVGWAAPAKTFPQFGAFVLVKQ